MYYVFVLSKYVAIAFMSVCLNRFSIISPILFFLGFPQGPNMFDSSCSSSFFESLTQMDTLMSAPIIIEFVFGILLVISVKDWLKAIASLSLYFEWGRYLVTNVVVF